MKKLFAVILLSISFSKLFGQGGVLDSTFGGNGIITADSGVTSGFPWTIALQSDGKIVAAGSYMGSIKVIRYNSDGTLDNSFSTNDMASQYVFVASVGIQSDGKIIIGGTVEYPSSDFFLNRYNIDGTIDSIFGNNGTVTTDIAESFDEMESIAIQPDGKILAAGESSIGILNPLITLVRYNADGSLDSSFSEDGKTRVEENGYRYAFSIALQQDGKILIAGGKFDNTQDLFALIRYNINGSLDSSFSDDGLVTTKVGLNDDAYSVAVQSDGKIIAAGPSLSALTYDYALVRYNTNGTPDSSFGSDGIITTDIGDDNANAVAIQPDNRIIVGGSTLNDFALVRYNPDGSLDNTFDYDGIVTTSIGMGAGITSVAIQPDGKIVAGGQSFISGNDYEFAMARYLPGFSLGILNFTSSISLPLIYPNPIQQTEQLKYTLTSDETLTLSLYDVNGSVLKTFFTNQKKTAGDHTEQLNLGAIAAGSYLLTLSNNTGTVSVKMMKQ